MAWNVIHFASLDSTSDYVKRSLSSLPHFSLVQADIQTAGRGRRGRRWENASGDLLFSFLLKEGLQEKDYRRLPLLCGIALSDALTSFGVETQIKWPNDLYFKNRKIAGILAEAITQGEQSALVCGVGVNLAKRDFPVEIAQKAGSLGHEGFSISPKELLSCFEKEFQSLWQKREDIDLAASIQGRDYLYGKEVTLDYYGENLVGKAMGIGNEGELLLQGEDGELKKVISGEAELRLRFARTNKMVMKEDGK